MSCKTTAVLAAYLEHSKDAPAMLALLRDKYPRSLSTYLTLIRKDWLTLNTVGPDYEKDMAKVRRGLQERRAAATTRTEQRALAQALIRLDEFDGLDTAQRYAVQRGLRQQGYTNHAPTDEALTGVRLLPDYVADLRMNTTERLEVQRRSQESLEKKSGDAFEVAASAKIRQSVALLQDPRSNAFDLACALSFVTGRRMVEIFRTGSFDPVAGDDRAAVFSGQAKKRDSEDAPYKIPLLAELADVNAGLARLRTMKNTEDMTNSDVNLRYSTSCNSAARRFFGPGRKFHDMRMAYGVVSFHAAMPHTYSINLWLSKALGHQGIGNSLNYSCVHVVGLDDAHKMKFTF